MKRRHLVFLTASFTLVFIVATAPASLLGTALQHASNRTWNLAGARGTLWDGQGVLTAQPGKDAREASLPPIGWKLTGISASGLSFGISVAGQPAGQLQVGVDGWHADLRSVGIDARDVTPLLPGLLNKGAWQGFVNIQKVAAHGSWQAARLLLLELQWLNASTSLMPQGELGSFAVKAHSEEVGISFTISSQDGPVVVSGQGRHSARQGFHFSGELIDNADLAKQFPGFLSAYLQPTGEPRRYTLQISQLDL